jgi:hypothetical protein
MKKLSKGGNNRKGYIKNEYNHNLELYEVNGYESEYKISKEGVVVSFLIPNKPRILRQNNIRGYKRVVLCKGGIKKQWMVHRLVALQFIPNTENKPQINHIDGNPSNNKVDNLEWCTISENAIHAFRVLGKVNPLKGRFGKLHPTYGKGVLIRPKSRVKCDNFDMEFESISEASRALGIHASHISLVCLGKANFAHGLSFRYL